MLEEKIILSDHYGSIEETDRGYELVFERMLNHPVTKVWEALTNPEKIALWLSPNHDNPSTEIDLRLGGKVRLQFMMAAPEGEITELDIGKVIEMSWDEEHISRWELSEEINGKCRLLFTEIFTEDLADTAFLRENIAGWHGYLDFLAMSLDGKQVPRAIPEEWDEIKTEVIEEYEKKITALIDHEFEKYK